LRRFQPAGPTPSCHIAEVSYRDFRHRQVRGAGCASPVIENVAKSKVRNDSFGLSGKGPAEQREIPPCRPAEYRYSLGVDAEEIKAVIEYPDQGHREHPQQSRATWPQEQDGDLWISQCIHDRQEQRLAQAQPSSEIPRPGPPPCMYTTEGELGTDDS